MEWKEELLKKIEEKSKLLQRCSKCGRELYTDGVLVFYFSNYLTLSFCWKCWEEFCLSIIKHKLACRLEFCDKFGEPPVKIDYFLKS